MVPRRGSGRRSRPRLPRTRGDGPDTNPKTVAAFRAPPHTRGWSLAKYVPNDPFPGSPAHAGMVPGACTTPRARRRLPRTRGDGPRFGGGLMSTLAAPPHTRGWSLRAGEREREVEGSPAHAGMVLTMRCPCRTPCRLPRTRGDGPVAATGRMGNIEAPPHTRGWSPPMCGSRGHRAGSPAHAGMVPGRSGTPPAGSGLPRTRGDGPGAQLFLNLRAGAPPHTRGWSPLARDRTGWPHGSPAHAGMVPGLSRRRVC